MFVFILLPPPTHSLSFSFTTHLLQNLYNGVSEGSGSPDSLGVFIGVVVFIFAICVTVVGGMLAYMYMSRLIVN